MKRIFLFLPLLLFADVNPFNAGINSGYGLTSDEKAILENKKNIKQIENNISVINKKIDNLTLKLVSYDESISNLNERISAFNTILSELSIAKQNIRQLREDVNNTNQKYNFLLNRVNKIETNLSILQKEINDLKETIKVLASVQNENFNYLKNAISKLIVTIKNQNKELSVKEAFKKAKALFFSGKYNKAKEYFLYTLSKNYLPATSAYYLGEIAFKNKNYKEALAYYKKSIEIYPRKTSFKARLLYHTALSFEKLGNIDAAKLSLQKLIKDYSNSKFAELAKKELEKLK